MLWLPWGPPRESSSVLWTLDPVVLSVCQLRTAGVAYPQECPDQCRQLASAQMLACLTATLLHASTWQAHLSSCACHATSHRASLTFHVSTQTGQAASRDSPEALARACRFLQDVNALRKTKAKGLPWVLELIAYSGEGIYYFIEQLVW